MEWRYVPMQVDITQDARRKTQDERTLHKLAVAVIKAGTITSGCATPAIF